MKRRKGAAPRIDDTIPKLQMRQLPCQGFTGLPPHRDPDLRLRVMEEVMAEQLGLRKAR